MSRQVEPVGEDELRMGQYMRGSSSSPTRSDEWVDVEVGPELMERGERVHDIPS